MPSLTAHADILILARRDIRELAANIFYLFWFIEWNNYATKYENFYFINTLETSSIYYIPISGDFGEIHEKFFGPRITIPFEEHLFSVYDATFKKFLFSLFFLERIRYTEVPWYICPFRHVDKVWKQNINFLPAFFQFGFIFPPLPILLFSKMPSIGYYLYFYSEILQPYFSYKKIYTINWP